MSTSHSRNVRVAKAGLVVNFFLAITKFLAGIFGHSYALIADGIESSTDIFSSLIVWKGLHISSAPADENHPFGHGKAEAIAAAAVSLMLLVAAMATALAAIKEILTPHYTPAPFTLIVLFGVIVIKEMLFRTVLHVSDETKSHVVKTDAWHHRSDAITSAAAFFGILISLYGGPGWESADDWAALLAAGLIAVNGVRLLMPAIHDLMDGRPSDADVEQFRSAALSVPSVLGISNLRLRRIGAYYHAYLDVQADSNLTLEAAHTLSHDIKSAFQNNIPLFADCSIHMEPSRKPKDTVSS